MNIIMLPAEIVVAPSSSQFKRLISKVNFAVIK